MAESFSFFSMESAKLFQDYYCFIISNEKM